MGISTDECGSRSEEVARQSLLCLSRVGLFGGWWV